MENEFLKSVSAIDPQLIRSPNSLVLKRLLNLPSCIKVLSNEKEVRKLLSSSNLPESGDLECLVWWKLIKHSYPCLFKVVTAAVSVFHGPRAESSFNVMGDVMDKKSCQINMETYSIFQDVKYGLKARKPKSSKSSRSVDEYFSREDKYFSPVDKSLTRNMSNASKLYTKKKSEKRSLANGDHDGVTRKKLRLMVAEKSSISESQHQEIISAAYNPERLQQAAIITISKTSTSTITTTSKTSTTTTSNKDKNVKAKKDKKKYSTISMFFKSDKHAN